LEVLDHLLGFVAVPANQEVNVFGENGAGVAGVVAILDHFGEQGR
jgi:hypothetical protein